MRLDTFSKTIAPGCRLGWITAQPALIERYLRITETSTQQPSGFVQSLVAELILGPLDANDGGRGGAKDGQGWGMDGWVRWLEGLRGAYERRMQTMCRILDQGKFAIHTASGSHDTFAGGGGDGIAKGWDMVHKIQMYDFAWPRGGMFVWVRMNLSSHPLYTIVPLAKLSHALWIHLTTKPYLVLVAPGTIFSPTAEIAETRGPNYFRLCFAAVAEEDVDMASHRVVAALNSFWTKTDVNELEGVSSTSSSSPLEGASDGGVGQEKWLFVAKLNSGNALTL